ncbi:MAG: M50 family metallopeptidase [Halanaerobiaceae bacterium]
MIGPGFAFKVNPLFLCLLAVFLLLGRGIEVFLAFGLVGLHEVVHIVFACRAGYPVKRLELFPFGGVVEYSGLLEMDPGQEIKISLVGPLFNLFVAAGIFVCLYFDFIPAYYYINLLLDYNLLLGTFNFLPALPLDGGRVLRGLLTSRLGFRWGTEIAVKVTKFLAGCGMAAGVLALVFRRSNLWLLLLSFFVYGAVLREQEQVIYRLMGHLTHRREFVQNLRIKPVFEQVVKDDLPLREVITSLLPGKYNLFLVLDEDFCLCGRLSETKILNSFLELEDRDVRVGKLLED